ncbi:MAG: T9SS type A sorting domain-containing protein, partial [Bacteroidota bacterium]|nr:T9SS type A sorting domain-containing protein [Bacteroidota bacterium]
LVAPPTATATSNGPVCVGENIQLTGTTNNGTSFSWTGPGGFTSTEQNPVITAATASNSGSYTFTATASGCTSSGSSTNVMVNALPSGVTASASDVTVFIGDTIDLAATGTAVGIALSESFNGATNDWTTANASTGGSSGGPSVAAWTLRPSPYVYNSTTFSSNNASQFYMSNSDAQGSGGTTITTLTSPAFSLAGNTTATLNFHHYYRYLSTNDTTQVQVSTDGTTWTSVQTYTSTQGAPSAFVLATINLNAYVGAPTVYLRFRYRSAYGWYWAVDNVTVSGQQSATFAWSSDPAGFTSTEQNPQNVVVNETTTYTVTASTPQGCTATASVTVTAEENLDCPGLGNFGDPCNDNDPSTLNDAITAECVCAGTPTGPTTEAVILEINTDANGQQISWEIAAQGTNAIMCSGANFPNNATITSTCNLPEGCFVLRVFDSAGDGITNGGYILRTFPENERIIDNSNNFTTGFVSAIANDQGFCLPIGDDRLIYTSCDKMDWVTNQFIVASLNPVVSAEWINGAPNSQQDNNSGYEFWFFDPNGSYSYRHFRSHSTSHGYPATGPARAAHLRLNLWSAANQIPTGVMMNVRVRGVVNGDPLEWGPACRFKIDPLAAQCPMTKLMDIPGNQFLSCGQYRQFAPGQYVHARPVSGATQYQFRFRQPAEGFEVVRTTSSYYAQLWWTVPPPLQAGSQYEVDVRAFKNGQWCPWGEICTLNIGVQAQGGNLNTLHDEADQIAPELNMWPNPNRGDLLHLSLDMIPEEVNTISVDIFDLRGQRLLGRTIAIQEGSMNTVLDLGNSMAAGIYLVNITVGEDAYTKRLVIQR